MASGKFTHRVVIAGGGPTGMTLAAELKLAGIDVAIIERRDSQELVGARAGDNEGNREIALRRNGQPEDCAKVVEFQCAAKAV